MEMLERHVYPAFLSVLSAFARSHILRSSRAPQHTTLYQNPGACQESISILSNMLIWSILEGEVA